MNTAINYNKICQDFAHYSGRFAASDFAKNAQLEADFLKLLETLSLEAKESEDKSKYYDILVLAVRWHDAIWRANGDKLLAKDIRNLGQSICTDVKAYRYGRAKVMSENFKFHDDISYVNDIINLLRHERRHHLLLPLLQEICVIEPRTVEVNALQVPLARYLGQYQVAEDLARKLIAFAGEIPILHAELGMIEIHKQDYLSGYTNLVKWWRTPDSKAFLDFLKNQPIPLRLEPKTDIRDKKLAIFLNDGFGGMIQYFRFTRGLLDRGAKVIILSSENRRPIFSYYQAIFPEVEIKTLDDPEEVYDYWMINELLPYYFETTVETLPVPVPAIIPHELETYWKNWLALRRNMEKPLVGFAVSGDHLNVNDAIRSMQLKQLFEAISPFVQLVNLQKKPKTTDLEFMKSHPEILDPMGEVQTIFENAAIIKNMDLVIAVDSGVLHLAGNQNAEVWGMLYDPPEYRWPATGQTSPWYPSLRLFRQKGRQANNQPNWTPVLDEIRQALIKRYHSN